MKKKTYVLIPNDTRKESIRGNAINFINQLNLEKAWEIIIQPYRHDHTKEQRGWFHFCCKMLGDELGYSQGEIKEAVKEHVYGKTEITIGNVTYQVTESSEYDSDGKKRNTVDYGELIDGVYLMASEAGVYLPNPDPRLRKSA